MIPSQRATKSNFPSFTRRLIMASKAQRDAWTAAAPKEIARIKRHLIREIRKRVEPLFWESGFVSGTPEARTGRLLEPRGLRVFVFRREQGYRANGYVLDQVRGFCEHGVITEVYVGMATHAYEDLPVEDLRIALAFAERAVQEARSAA